MTGASQLGKKGTFTLNDTSPHIRPAGKTNDVSNEGAQFCLSMGERPSTPPEIKKYRQSTIHEPGKIVKHYGLADDVVKDGPFGYVANTIGERPESVHQVMKSYPTSDLMRWEREQREQVYESAKRDPLGKSMVRGHIIPESISTFGSKIDAKFKDKNPEAKSLIYPVGTELDENTAATAAEGTEGEGSESNLHDLYVRTHGNYAPGEQRRRGYNWDAAGFKPDAHVFGITEKQPYHNGVAKALTQNIEQNTKLIPRAVSDFKLANTQTLGQSKNLGQRNRVGVGSDHIFGVPSRRVEEWGVQQLICGDYSMDDQNPDPDLGKSLRSGFRNESKDADRVFGAPSIRTDLNAPKVKSVADNQNYGNELGAFSLIYPSDAMNGGIEEEEYLCLREPEELFELFGQCVQGDQEKFNTVVDYATRDSNARLCSAALFLKAKRELEMHSMGF
ncbi:hypothetical protein HOP50_09g56260 [Chloropicon primus]|uniref:EFHB C-terminal EF-hand domain-containing protein n=1 Tax=Chloropicon primus TaxID=1764295 RepID=A0A5B8MRH9_9CHLO|nr:hypothetical protein A3770_09p56040 [Chloropicon primus]UPR02300.1 hypothetical protein HOP50_09g56260 [Chloropicon primus]|eukprot:QDZ23086.1 hypothetical protein A3770_09p56040 [Chloropicon primus]